MKISHSIQTAGVIALAVTFFGTPVWAKEKFEYKLIPVVPTTMTPLPAEPDLTLTQKPPARAVQPGGASGTESPSSSPGPAAYVNTTKHNTKDRVTVPSDASAGAGAASGKKGLNAVNVR